MFYGSLVFGALPVSSGRGSPSLYSAFGSEFPFSSGADEEAPPASTMCEARVVYGSYFATSKESSGSKFEWCFYS